MVQTSHIGNLLLPGSTAAAINTTYNFTTGTASGSSSANCTSNPASAFNTSLCPADNTALVGGTLGGILGAALIGALLALAFALRSRKHYRYGLAGTRAALATTDAQAAQDKANFQKQFEEQQRRIQSIPPTYNMMSPNGVYDTLAMHGHGYSTAHVTELPHSISNEYSELGSGDSSNRVELISETPKGG